MRAVIQRVSASEVRINKASVGKIAHGLNVLLGIKEDDTEADMDYIINKLINLRIFEDAEGKMNRSILDVDGELLLVSQFTLMVTAVKGDGPALPEVAQLIKQKKNTTFLLKN